MIEFGWIGGALRIHAIRVDGHVYACDRGTDQWTRVLPSTAIFDARPVCVLDSHTEQHTVDAVRVFS